MDSNHSKIERIVRKRKKRASPKKECPIPFAIIITIANDDAKVILIIALNATAPRLKSLKRSDSSRCGKTCRLKSCRQF